MQKKILEICLSPNLGGLELFVLHCYDYFSENGSCNIALSPQKKLDNTLNDSNTFHLKRNKLLPFIPAFKLAKHIDEQDIDVIHFHWNNDMTTVVLAKVFSKRKPDIVLSRHMTMTRFKDDFYHRFLYKNVDKMIAVSFKVKEQIFKYNPLKIQPEVQVCYLGSDKPIMLNTQDIKNY
jgi:hypothetical protein